MRVTTFIAGMAIGALAGMYLADRRSLSHLQSKIQLAGDVVTDVMGNMRGKVMDTAFSAMGMPSSSPSHNKSVHTMSQPSTAIQQQSHRDSINLERIKDLIERDPEVKRQVDAILHESGNSSMKTAETKSSTASGSVDKHEHAAATSSAIAKKEPNANAAKASHSSDQHSHH